MNDSSQNTKSQSIVTQHNNTATQRVDSDGGNDNDKNKKWWENLSDQEKQEIRLSGKKHLKSIQKQVCDQLRCEYCHWITFTSLRMYRLHLLSKAHLKREQKSKISDTWSCKICNLFLPNESEWNKHSIGRKHKNKMKEYSEKNYPLVRPYFESDLKNLKQNEFKEEREEDGDDLYSSFIS